MSNEDFHRILAEIVVEEAGDLLGVPGVYEACSEHFNDQVLDRWAAEQESED